jgi:hypothetical protein
MAFPRFAEQNFPANFVYNTLSALAAIGEIFPANRHKSGGFEAKFAFSPVKPLHFVDNLAARRPSCRSRWLGLRLTTVEYRRIARQFV